mgnify:CR=1 FL=1
MNREKIVSQLIKEGFSEKTLVRFNDNQLKSLEFVPQNINGLFCENNLLTTLMIKNKCLKLKIRLLLTSLLNF